MNILLWVVQTILAVLCISGGGFKIFKLDELKKNVTSMRTLPKSVWIAFGVFECLAGACLMIPDLSAFAASAMFVESILISGIYLFYRDFAPISFTVIMALMAGFISYGRFMMGSLS